MNDHLMDSISGSQSVVRGSQEIGGHFSGDPWAHFCNGYVEATYSVTKEVMFC